MKITAEVNEKKLVCDVNINGEKVTLKLDDFILDAEIQQLEPQAYLVNHNNKIYEALVTKKSKNEFTVNVNGRE
ncbi:MAG TPA: hypothetical protein VNK26_07685, partial [Pyrinomonadaceae bacterium]|nr:hypothetical protein [Pyrinomonadaceae bacterium]